MRGLKEQGKSLMSGCGTHMYCVKIHKSHSSELTKKDKILLS